MNETQKANDVFNAWVPNMRACGQLAKPGIGIISCGQWFDKTDREAFGFSVDKQRGTWPIVCPTCWRANEDATEEQLNGPHGHQLSLTTTWWR